MARKKNRSKNKSLDLQMKGKQKPSRSKSLNTKKKVTFQSPEKKKQQKTAPTTKVHEIKNI